MASPQAPGGTFAITGNDSTIRGLVINRFIEIGMRVLGANNVIAGKYLGTNLGGTAATGNVRSVEVDFAPATNNRFGGTSVALVNQGPTGRSGMSP